MAFVIVTFEALQRDAQHDLARSCRPTHAAFGTFHPFEKATDAQRHIAQARPKVAQGSGNTVARGSGAFGKARVTAKAAAIPSGQKPLPVLRDTRAHLGQFEIFAQAFGDADKVRFQLGFAVAIQFAPQGRDRAFGGIEPQAAAAIGGFLGAVGHIAVLGRIDELRLADAACAQIILG